MCKRYFFILFVLKICTFRFANYKWIKMDSTKVFFLNATTAGASLCRKNIVWDDLYKQIVLIPSKNEQVKIGLFFSNLDKQISLQTQRLEKLKQIKAACLDKMFV